ncbi:MAG: hypothetical protein GWN93_22285 [Deltaproteobacteria bacterium]|nr:hypothetical protein [Deltaproteobacteria bacterium]
MRFKEFWDEWYLLIVVIVLIMAILIMNFVCQDIGCYEVMEGSWNMTSDMMLDVQIIDVEGSSLDRLLSFIGFLNNNMNITRKEVVMERPVEVVVPFRFPNVPPPRSGPSFDFEIDDAVGDFRGRIYTIGTSITNGYKLHDADHGRISGGGCLDGFYNYYFDKRMIFEYRVMTDTCDWYRDKNWKYTWDKYNLGTGGFMNTYTCANGVDPFPLNSSSAGAGMCLDCVDDVVNGTWGRGLFRTIDVNWSCDVSFLIVEGGHHDQNSCWEGENSSGMAEDILEIYEQSRFYNYTLVLLAHLPVGRSSNQNMSIVRETNRWRKEFAENYTDMIYVDFVDSVFYDENGGANESWFVESNGYEVHPNKNGLRVMGELIADKVYGFMVDNGMLDIIG